MANKKEQVSVALLFGHASFLVRQGESNLKTSTNLVTFLNWATSPYIKRLQCAFVLIDSALTDIADRLTNNPHIASLDIPLPDQTSRKFYLENLSENTGVEEASDFSIPDLAKLTAGISLTDLRVLVKSTLESGERLDIERFRKLKKTLLERQASGLLEIIEPKWGLDMVVGHEAAKRRLRDDAALLAQGKLETVPMGYLLCGPVGTGKSFLAQCAAGDLGVPCIKLKNFRSKYVGETESNLERVLGVLRSMGPVLVFVDEADAMLGDRNSSGDSGTSARTFGMIAQQMGDTRYRGKILWMLATTRPDLLPIDLKRQGRAEVHIPLFYPTDFSEMAAMFEALAKKIGAKLENKNIPEISERLRGQISGADIEGLLGRANRQSILSGSEEITAKALKTAIEGFIPMAQNMERKLQKIAAIIECTDEEFLPEAIQKEISEYGGRDALQNELNILKSVVDGN